MTDDPLSWMKLKKYTLREQAGFLAERQEWASRSETFRHARAEYWQKRAPVPDGYDSNYVLGSAMEKIASAWKPGRFLSERVDPTLNYWLPELENEFFEDEVWSFLDYPEFGPVINARASGLYGRAHDKAMLEPPVWNRRCNGMSLPGGKWLTLDCYILPSKFNWLEIESTINGRPPLCLTEWYVLVFPRAASDARRVGKILFSGKCTGLDGMQAWFLEQWAMHQENVRL